MNQVYEKTQNYTSIFGRWKEKASEDLALREELLTIEKDSCDLEERFCRDLEFGTGGMRGLIGAGLNRMNIFTVRRATQGLANYLKKNYNYRTEENMSTVIAYDSRHLSKEFALQAALVLAHNDIKVYIFKEITPTPLLSFAVREIGAQAGIVITASHNPKEYNGFKVYGADGGQITDSVAAMITNEIRQIEDVFAVEKTEYNEAKRKGLLFEIGDEHLDKYIEKTKNIILNQTLINKSASDVKIVYTPLHGTGLIPLQKLFWACGFNNLMVVEEQAEPDPDFSTVVCPNPEDTEACAMAVEKAKLNDADLVIITDPDADRVGAIVRDYDGQYRQLSGNQIGALLIDYILTNRQLQDNIPDNGAIIKTIVTSSLGADIAALYGVSCIEVLTGFKYIGEKIKEFEQENNYHFLFGYEESYGYLLSDHVRDKDALQASLSLAEMTLYHKSNGITLVQRLNQIYEKIGYFEEEQINISLPGLEGCKKIKGIMDSFRNKPPTFLQINNIVLRDYLTGVEYNKSSGSKTRLLLPKSDVLHYRIDDGLWFALRPSGTESKLKIYFGSKGLNSEDAVKKLSDLKERIMLYLGKEAAI